MRKLLEAATKFYTANKVSAETDFCSIEQGKVLKPKGRAVASTATPRY